MKNNISKHNAQLFSAILLIVVGCILLIVGFIVPPPGEIHNSVLVAFGEILTFAGAVFGMKYRYQNDGDDSHENNNLTHENA